MNECQFSLLKYVFTTLRFQHFVYWSASATGKLAPLSLIWFHTTTPHLQSTVPKPGSVQMWGDKSGKVWLRPGLENWNQTPKQNPV